MGGNPVAMDRFAADPPVEKRLGDRLREAGATVSIVEGCTGGLVSTLLTSVPGASEFLRRTVVPYSYDQLRFTLGVTREALDEHGAVSEPVVVQSAKRARDLTDADWGVATTGIAGPGGGSDDKPVGTGIVGIARASPWGSEASTAEAIRFEFDGDRAAVRERLARAALSALLDRVEDQ